MVLAEGSVEQTRIQSPEKSSGFFSGFKEKILEWRDALINITRQVAQVALAVAVGVIAAASFYLAGYIPNEAKIALGVGIAAGAIILAHTHREIRPGGGYNS